MRKVKSLLNKMSSPMRPPAGLGDLRLTKSFVSKVFSLFITTQSAEDSRQRRSGMTALLDVKAFTLVELLVVVLIIGILSAIAIPMYQGAVDKSHWSTMLPGAKALKDAEEAIRMSNGLYTSNMDNLDVRMPNGDVQYTLETINDDGNANVIRATNSKMPTVRLSSYLDENTIRAGHLYCEANDGEAGRGTRLCSKLLNGDELGTTDDGYTQYLLDQEVDKATCAAVSRSWSTSKTTCYKTTAERCTALGMPAIAGQDKCGYVGSNSKTIKNEGYCISSGYLECRGLVLEEGAICEAHDHSCQGLTMNGGTCIGDSGHQSQCTGSTINAGVVDCTRNTAYCGRGNTFNGGICLGGTGLTCTASTFKSGSICYANDPNGYACLNDGNWPSSYQGTGCCCGNYCGNAPKCADFNIACDPQYMK